MAYALIAKLEKFTSEEDNAQVWLNNFLRYFSNNNSINRLVNTFTTIKQGENEAVTTYLGCFHRNLCQIQAINANYFTVAQILNQFIHGLRSSILQYVHPMHPVDLQAAITNARDFKATKLEANHTQAINLVINGSSELESKLKQFIVFIIVNQSTVATGNASISSELLTYNAAATLSTTSISNANLLTNDTGNLSATATTHLLATALSNLSAPTNSNTTTKLTLKRNPKAEIDPIKLEIVDEDAQPNNLETHQHPTLTSNILPATITKNKSLDTIFLFELEEPLTTPLFNKVTLEEKPITAMYTDVKVDGHSIKLILDSRLADSIITKQFMDQLSHRVDRAANARIITTNGATKTLIGEIDDFSFEVNGIIILIKVLVMKAIQYQALIGNDWLSKTNTILD
ncbi:hypothetical protein G9A89_007618 [Geosiphon pyriformis]|nr:hypothetical protein G9A89_007618 [Geosiphon pyriformis]